MNGPHRNNALQQKPKPTRSARTCVACGQKDSPTSLIRFALTEAGQLVPDLRRNLGGRGAHVCPTRVCVDNALNKRLFNRVLKREINYGNRQVLVENIILSLRRQLETLIRSAALANFINPGVALTKKAMREGLAKALLVAEDSRERNSITAIASENGIPIIFLKSKEELGGLLDRKDTGAASINDINLAGALANVSRRLEALVQ